MEPQNPENWDEIQAGTWHSVRQQYDFVPYPDKPLADSPKDDANLLFVNNLTTAYYLRDRRVISSQNKRILDAGCGTGWKSLALAEANPGAEIIGIDLSPKSIEIAEKRLKYQGFNNATFQVLPLEEIGSLNLEFDYINCDEVLSFLPDPIQGLKAMQRVLKPQGIIRSNLHSSLQRQAFLRAQTAFKTLGLLHPNAEEMEIDIVREIMTDLAPEVDLKSQLWHSVQQETPDSQRYFIIRDLLLQNDKGFTIPELFNALESANLELIQMVNWRQWQFLDLLQDPENPPAYLAFALAELPVSEQLHLFELFHPIHRLLDFWASHSEDISYPQPVSEWTMEEWENSTIYLHPQLQTKAFETALKSSLQTQEPLNITSFLSATTGNSQFVELPLLNCLLNLIQNPQTFPALSQQWQEISSQDSPDQLIETLIHFESLLFVLIEQ